MVEKKNFWGMWFPAAVVILIVFRGALYIYFLMSGGNYIHPDSALYLELAEHLIETGDFFLPKLQPEVIQPFGIPARDTMRILFSDVPEGPEVFRTPGYPFFLVCLHWLKIDNPYSIVFVQEVIYVLSVLIFYHLGQQLFSKKIVQASVIFMLINSGGLVWPKYLISETLFLPFLISGILFVGLYLKHNQLRFLIFAGILMGIAAWIRPAIQYLPIVVVITIGIFYFNSFKKWMHAVVLFMFFLMTLSPWLIRNYYHYGQFFVSGQGSNLLANYHVPAVWHWPNVDQFDKPGQQLAQQEIKKIVDKKEKELGRSIDAVEFFKLQQSWAVKELSHYPVTYVKAWLAGAARVMYESFVNDFYEQMRFSDHRLHFLDVLMGNFKAYHSTRSTGVISGVIYYFLHQDRFYLFHTILSMLTAVFAVAGAISITMKRNCFLWLMMLVNFYFIFLPGPIGYGRYRFPVDVFWFVQACFGYMWIVSLLKLAQQKNEKQLLAD